MVAGGLFWHFVCESDKSRQSGQITAITVTGLRSGLIGPEKQECPKIANRANAQRYQETQNSLAAEYALVKVPSVIL